METQNEEVVEPQDKVDEIQTEVEPQVEVVDIPEPTPQKTSSKKTPKAKKKKKEENEETPAPTYHDEERSPQFKFDPKTGELSLFTDEEL